jgi:hypothetical protein
MWAGMTGGILTARGTIADPAAIDRPAPYGGIGRDLGLGLGPERLDGQVSFAEFAHLWTDHWVGPHSGISLGEVGALCLPLGWGHGSDGCH